MQELRRSTPEELMEITKLSAAKLETLYAKRQAVSSQVCSALIQAGYGMERGSDTRARAETTGDALAVKYVETSDATYEVVREIEARKTYQGNLRPIKRATF
jgi:hypothetical protein